MEHFQDLVQQGSLHAWLFIPAAIVLGALHGLEPGHSKTMMAAFIIAVRGTIPQAALLGLSAALSHSLIIWILAFAALHYGSQMNAGNAEPYFQVVSAAIIFCMALWMAWRTHRDIGAEARHGHDHGHDHDDHHHDGHHHHHDHPHETSLGEYQDAHELAHAADIEKRFAHRSVTTGQIVLFGVTGGLMPCPAAFTLVLICLQLKKFALGVFMVLAFSAGLAFTLVAVGALAALSLRHAEKRFNGFGGIARRLPYLSSAVLVLLALLIGLQGWWRIAAGHS